MRRSSRSRRSARGPSGDRPAEQGRIAKERVPLVTSAGVVAQVWRGGGDSQVPVAFLLRRTLVVDLTARIAKILGRLLGERGTSDVVDARVAFLAKERGWPVLTSDLDDLQALDPTIRPQKV